MFIRFEKWTLLKYSVKYWKLMSEISFSCITGLSHKSSHFTLTSCAVFEKLAFYKISLFDILDLVKRDFC